MTDRFDDMTRDFLETDAWTHHMTVEEEAKLISDAFRQIDKEATERAAGKFLEMYDKMDVMDYTPEQIAKAIREQS